MAQGKRALSIMDMIEVIDLYKWGARMSDLEGIYGVDRRVLRAALKRKGVPMRPPHRTVLANTNTGRQYNYNIKSSRPTIPAGVRVVDDDQAPDRLLRSYARAQLDKRIAEHQAGVSKSSCPEEAS